MNIEDYKVLESIFNKMPESDKNKLNEILKNHEEEFKIDSVGIMKTCIEELIKQKRKEIYIDKKIDSYTESVLLNNYVENIKEPNNIIYDKERTDYNKLSSAKKEEYFEKITDSIKYEQIKHRQAEIEMDIKKTLEELPKEAQYSIIKLKEYRRMMATQINPKVFTDESLITAQYLKKLDQSLLSKIREQAALSMQATTLGHNLTSREQGYVNYSDLLYYSKLEDLSLVYAMFYAEFPTEGFGEYAKEKLEEKKRQENQKPKMM